MASRLVNGRWRARIYLSGGGERTKVFGSKREAVAWEVHNRGRRPESKESLTRWLERMGPDVLLGGLSPSTRATYRSHLVVGSSRNSDPGAERDYRRPHRGSATILDVVEREPDGRCRNAELPRAPLPGRDQAG